MFLKVVTFILFLLPITYANAVVNKQSLDNEERETISLEKDQTIEELELLAEQKFDSAYFGSAAKHYTKILGYYDALGKIDKKIKTLHRLGSCYRLLGSHKEALDYYSQALELSQKHNIKLEIAKSLHYIGRIYGALGEHEESINNYFIKALTIFRELDDKHGIFDCLNDIGIAYGELGNKEKTLEYFQNLLTHVKKVGDMDEIMTVTSNVGHVLLLQERYDEAMSYFQEVVQMSKTSNNELLLAQVNLNIARLYLEKEEYIIALSYAEKSRDVIEHTDDVDRRKEVYEIFFRIHLELGNSSESLEYHKKFFNLYDSVSAETNSKNLAEMRTIYEMTQKENEIELLNAELKYSSVWNTSLLIGIITILAFASIYFVQNIKLRKAYRNLVHINIDMAEIDSGKNKSIHSEKYITDIDDKAQRYSSSPLSREQEDNLIEHIKNAFEKDKLFIGQDFSVTKLADHINTNKTYVSQVINEHFGKNFSTLTQEYRIKEARILLSKEENWNFTIETIANMVGFKSRSTFNSAFKNETGLTPSYFLHSIKKQRNA